MEFDELFQFTQAPSDDGSVSVATSIVRIRDEDYYFDDGSIVLLVQDHLFKIHRSLFERDSPFFRTLFSLPQGKGEDEILEGQSDNNPITCQDSVEDSGHYAGLCTLDIPKLIRVVTLSHKYEFETYRTWALNALDAYSTAHPLGFLDKCGEWVNIGRIFDLAIRWKVKSLTDRIEDEWLIRISSGSESERVAVFEEALDIVEGSEVLREFHTKLYYTYLRSTGIFKAGIQDDGFAEIGSHMDHSLSRLSVERQRRLLNGFWSLSQLRVRLSQAPKLADNPSCPNHARTCTPRWDALWKSVLDNGAKECRWFSDPGELIEEMQRRIEIMNSGWPRFSAAATFPCVELVESQFRELKQNFKTSLASRFMLK